DQEARQALRLILELGLNQRGAIGSPWPVMEYWLRDGQAPQLLTRTGLRTMTLQPAAMRVEQIQGQWGPKQGPQVLFNFGQQAQDAQLALGVIRKYGFNQAGLIGQGIPSMYVFFHRDELRPPVLTVPNGRTSGKSIAVPRFSRLAKNQPDQKK